MNDTLQFLTQHGTVVLFFAVLAEQIGLPVPAFPFLIAAGALVGTGQMGLGVTIGLAVLAALLGDQVWYELGKRRGRPVLTWLCRISLEPMSCVRRTEDFFARHGVRSLVVAKFIPGLSTIAPPLAGIVGLRVPQYLLYNGAGTLLWVGSGIGLGYGFSDQLEEAVAMASHVGPTIAMIVAAGIGGYIVYKGLHRYRVGRLVPRLTVHQIEERIASGDKPVFIDLRPQGARQDVASIPGSLLLSMDELIARHHELPRNRDVIVYCACPNDAASVQAVWKLREKGVARAWPLEGGIEAWHLAVAARDGQNRLKTTEGITAAAY